MRCSHIVISFTLMLLLVSSTVIATPPRIKDFDPKKVAAAEAQMWKAYYDGAYAELAISLVKIMVAQFNVPYSKAISISIPTASAARKFHRLSYGASDASYQRNVVPDLTVSYQRLKRAAQQQHWRPGALAQAELAWWLARRQQHSRKEQYVGDKIAELYQLLYGVSNDNIKRAAFLRAQAAHMRDQQSNRNGVDWKSIEDRLALSYHFLKLGINQN